MPGKYKPFIVFCYPYYLDVLFPNSEWVVIELHPFEYFLNLKCSEDNYCITSFADPKMWHGISFSILFFSSCFLESAIFIQSQIMYVFALGRSHFTHFWSWSPSLTSSGTLGWTWFAPLLEITSPPTPARFLPLVSFSVQHRSYFSEKKKKNDWLLMTKVASLPFLTPSRHSVQASHLVELDIQLKAGREGAWTPVLMWLLLQARLSTGQDIHLASWLACAGRAEGRLTSSGLCLVCVCDCSYPFFVLISLTLLFVSHLLTLSFGFL